MAFAVQVRPSVGASSTAWVPIAPEAPGWLTTTTLVPSASARIGAVTRVTWSVEPPAPQGTMMLIGPPGSQSWAAAVPPIAASESAASAARVTLFVMKVPPGIRLSSSARDPAGGPPSLSRH